LRRLCKHQEALNLARLIHHVMARKFLKTFYDSNQEMSLADSARNQMPFMKAYKPKYVNLKISARNESQSMIKQERKDEPDENSNLCL